MRRPLLFAYHAALALLLCGCAPTLFSQDEHANPERKDGPTVRALVDHITCELEAKYGDNTKKDDVAKNDYKSLWHYFAQDNFVAAVDLNLLLTQMEGFNPGYSAITPLDALGHGIPIVQKAGSPPTYNNATYNLTLAVGAQLNGTQDTSVDLTYVIDMSKIADAANGNGSTSMPNCADNAKMDDRDLGLQGDLQLDINIDEVLAGIDASGPVNVYNTSGPFAPDVTSSQMPSTDHGGGNFDLLSNSSLAAGKTPPSTTSSGSTSSGSTASSIPATTGFTSKIDFTVQGGLSGGPSWTLLRQKYPVSGGNTSGQLLSYSHQTTDTLTITFAPTCQTEIMPQDLATLKLKKNLSDGGSTQNLNFSFDDQSETFSVLTGIDPSAFASINASGILGASTLGGGGLVYEIDSNAPPDSIPTLIGTIAWSGFVKLQSVQTANGTTTKTFTVDLTGIVTKTTTQRAVGNFRERATFSTNQTGSTATVAAVNIETVQASDQLAVGLTSDPKSLVFWKTIPYCDTVPGPAIQGIWNNAAAQVQLYGVRTAMMGMGQ